MFLMMSFSTLSGGGLEKKVEPRYFLVVLGSRVKRTLL